MFDVRRCMLLSSPIWLAAAAQGLAAQTTLPVTNVGDLRTAITTANGAGDFIIEMQSGTYVLTGNQLDNANVEGDLDIVKSSGTLLIRPATGATVTINANSVDRVLGVNNAINAPVTIEDITISGGRASDDGVTAGQGRGGAILKQGTGALTLTGVTLSGNQAVGSNGAAGAPGAPTANGGTGAAAMHGLGGGVYVENGTLQITGCTISTNVAQGGVGGAGGIGGNATMTFAGNGGEGGAGGAGHGGALYLQAGTVTIGQSTISSNDANGGPGGAGGNGGTASVGGQGGEGAFGGGGRGGFAYVQSGTLTITDSTLAGNAAAGGVSGDGGTGGDGISGGGGQLSQQGGAAQGGAIFGGGGTVNISASTLSGNAATAGAGGDGGIGGSGAYGGNGAVGGIGGNAHGGAIYVQNAAITITNATLSGNQVTGGSGGAGGDGGTAGSIGGNGGAGGAAGQSLGGAVYVRGVSITIRNSTLASNTATAGTPGAGGAAGGGATPGSAGGSGAVVFSRGGGAHEDGSSGASVDATSTILADNTATTNPDADGTLNANNCLIESGVTPASGTGNVTGTDPALAVLAGNGGLTQTHAIGAGSAALNVGSNPAALTTDQRGTGFPRDDGSGVDIGAFEFDPTAPTLPPTVTNPAAPVSVDAASYNIQGNAPANALVRIYSDLDNNGAVNGSDAVVAQQQLTGGGFVFSISTPLAQGAANNFTATAELSGVVESTPVNVPTITDTNGGGGGGTGGGNGGGGGGCSATEHQSWWGLLALLAAFVAAFGPRVPKNFNRAKGR